MHDIRVFSAAVFTEFYEAFDEHAVVLYDEKAIRFRGFSEYVSL